MPAVTADGDRRGSASMDFPARRAELMEANAEGSRRSIHVRDAQNPKHIQSGAPPPDCASVEFTWLQDCPTGMCLAGVGESRLLP